VEFARTRRDLTVVTAMVPLPHERDIINPNIVKVVSDRNGKALYFSRLPIPYRKDSPLSLSAGVDHERLRPGYFKHIGIYLYRREFLLKYVNFTPTPLEITESLEQLRILENGFPVYTVQVEEDSVSVDTAEDLEIVGALIAQREVK
jgi:3-deoxy-manno-octulosonate cytidylyltransferase (CMP-KDO synthetase)